MASPPLQAMPVLETPPATQSASMAHQPDVFAPSIAPSESPVASPSPKGERRPIDPSLPPDHPLEPGLATRGRGGSSAADRIAASEAALGPAKPAITPDPPGKSDFIAAARRAAQAAGSEPVTRDKRSQSPVAGTPASAKGLDRLGKRTRAILVAASVVVIV